MNPRFTNALVHETSPYLLQHAHNPVNWHPWGDEALKLSKQQDKPILVSIGYSACHWCHVMDIYMDALQAIAGSGGWPLNVFLTTDAKPFYGGTYFPPQKAFNRASWMDVLQSMKNVWQNKREEVEQQANKLVEHIRNANNFTASAGIAVAEQDDFYNAVVCRQMAEIFLRQADVIHGGYGRAPKFLHTYSLKFQLQFGHFFNAGDQRDHALLSLRKMLEGGIYDQLGGGIARYSTDDEWLAPHFEKMLYDNALFVDALCDAFAVSGKAVYKNGIEQTLQFVEREMKHAEGGFYAAIDADSEGVEGKFYVWRKSEIEELLGPGAEMFCEFYNVSAHGNWEDSNILNITTSATEFAKMRNHNPAEFEASLEVWKNTLLTARNKRIRPGTDDKILLNANALLITAFCKSYAALGNEDYKQRAVELYAFIDDKFGDGTCVLKHTYKEGVAKFPAFLDDYAYLIQACLQLQEITGNQDYVKRGRELMQHVLSNFADSASPFFFYTQHEQDDVIVRKIELYDGATPSANGVMAHNLLYLGLMLDEAKWTERGHEMMQGIAHGMKKYPTSFAVWAGIYLNQVLGINEIAITGTAYNSILKEVLQLFLPNKMLQSSTGEDQFPLLLGKDFKRAATIYHCQNYACGKPVYKTADLIKTLNNASNYKPGSQ
ncbi:MAG: thioredoxin domain-containing protein [Chitinophagaceae bacterium]|nr:MAG: thioredoxin domain-containing protein [Chitinophagaceae bacterium]